MAQTPTIVLPAGVNPGLTIHVPRGYERDRGDLVLVGLCRVCGERFYKGRESEWQKHVGKCAKRNIDELRAESLRQRIPIFDENTWDPEVAAHLKRVGVQMLREGRLEMRPHERANG